MTDPMPYSASFHAPAEMLDVSDIFKHGYSRAAMAPYGGATADAGLWQAESEKNVTVCALLFEFEHAAIK
jgi:hypothetical protein